MEYANSSKTDNFINAYEHFWDRLGDEGQQEDQLPNHESLSKLLDINPEGYLSKEIKDVLDELYSIKKICKEQLVVVRDLENYLNSVPCLNEHNPDTIRQAATVVKAICRRIAEVDELIDAANRTDQGVSEKAKGKYLH